MLNNFDELKFEDLAKMAQQGDANAEEYLIRAFNKTINRISRRYFIMGGDSQDVVQEAMIGLFKAIKNYRNDRDTKFSTFAELCMNRQIISAVKAANRNKHAPLNSYVSLDLPVFDDSKKTLEETLENEKDFDVETIILINDVMSYISANEEKIFTKNEKDVWNEYILGKSYEEIAEILDKNSKSIYNAMERIKAKVMNYLSV